MQITKRKRLVYKNMGDIKVGDSVMCPGTDKAKVVHINELGVSDIYKLTLSDGRSFRTHAKHLTTVSFREEDNKRVWDSLTTDWMMKHPEYHFTVLTDEIYQNLTWDDIEKTLPSHEAEPSDNIIPKTYDGIFIASIEKLDYQENCRCISLNNPEGFYYTDEAIITHNSTLSTLAQLYISVHYAMMWHPYRFFGMAMSSIFTQCLGGWNQKKASELLLEPFTQILEGAPYFQRVRTHQDLVDASAEDISDCIHWTTSTPTAQPLDSKIIMADGSVKLMGDIQIGDKIKSPSEGTTEVINIPYHGVADCYEIELEDGRTVRCSAEHLWNVRRTPESDWEVVNLQYIMDHPEYDWEIRELDDF